MHLRSEPSLDHQRPIWPWLLVIVLTGTATLWPLTLGKFVAWDDFNTIASNPRFDPATPLNVIDHWTTLNHMHLYVPVTYSVWHGVALLTQRLDRPEARSPAGFTADATRLDGEAFSTLNLLIHLTTACLLFVLLSRLVPDRRAALLGALLFAIHPVQVEAIGWISGTKDLLCALLLTVASLVFVEFRRDPRPLSDRRQALRYALLFVIGTLAILSKPTAVVLPGVLGVIDWLVLRNGFFRAVSITAPLLLIAVPGAVLARSLQTSDYVDTLVPLPYRPLVALDSLAFYVGKWVWPVGLVIDYGRTPVRVLESGWLWYTPLVPITIAAAAFVLRRRVPLLAAGLALAVVPLIPVLGIVPFDFQYLSGVADHYAYPAMIGLALAAAGCMSRLRGLPAGWAVFAILIPLAFLAHRQTHVWRDSRTLFEHVLSVRPDSWMAWNNLASSQPMLLGIPRQTAEDRARWFEMIDNADAMLDRALELKPSYGEATENRGALRMLRATLIAEEISDRRARRELTEDELQALLERQATLLREAYAHFEQAARLIRFEQENVMINAAWVHFLWSEHHHNRGDLPRARNALLTAIEQLELVQRRVPARSDVRRTLEQFREALRRLDAQIEQSS